MTKELIRRTLDLLEDVYYPHEVIWTANRQGQGVVAHLDGSGMYGNAEIAGVPIHVHKLTVDVELGPLSRQTGHARLIFQLHKLGDTEHLPLDKRAIDRIVNGILVKYRIGVDIGLKISPNIRTVENELGTAYWAVELSLPNAAKKLSQMYKKKNQNEQ